MPYNVVSPPLVYTPNRNAHTHTRTKDVHKKAYSHPLWNSLKLKQLKRSSGVERVNRAMELIQWKEIQQGKNTIITPNNIDTAHKQCWKSEARHKRTATIWFHLYDVPPLKKKKNSMRSEIRMVVIFEEEGGVPSQEQSGIAVLSFLSRGWLQGCVPSRITHWVTCFCSLQASICGTLIKLQKSFKCLFLRWSKGRD